MMGKHEEDTNSMFLCCTIYLNSQYWSATYRPFLLLCRQTTVFGEDACTKGSAHAPHHTGLVERQTPHELPDYVLLTGVLIRIMSSWWLI